jgi:hypothetical protein
MLNGVIELNKQKKGLQIYHAVHTIYNELQAGRAKPASPSSSFGSS